MPKEVYKQLKIAFKLLAIITFLTGVLYPLLVTAIAHVLFPWQADGSLLSSQGKIVGSRLIGQSFTADRYFWGRPSATTPFPYNAENSSGSNLGPSNPELLLAVKNRATLLQKADPEKRAVIPIDLVTASASGLDPELSPAAAFYQIPRIATARGIAPEKITALVRTFIQNRTFGILGEPRVNILELNLALDNLSTQQKNHG
jgi:K+-transporting ATPase ATPase C chain